MKLLILGEPLGETPIHYRGTDRATPSYCSNLPDDHPANQAFFWYTNESYPNGIVHDIDAAEKLIRAYASIEPAQSFELVEVVEEQEIPNIGNECFGYDISHSYHYSLLSWGLQLGQTSENSLSAEDLYWELTPILQLIQQFFRPQLNQYSLFHDATTAQFCLDCMMAVQAVRPGLWEHEEVKFCVLGIWKVRVDA